MVLALRSGICYTVLQIPGYRCRVYGSALKKNITKKLVETNEK